MSEQRLRAGFIKHLRKSPWVVFRHEDIFTAGIGDVSVTGRGVTCWIEVKYGKVVEWSSKLQRETMLRLEGHGCAFVLLFQSDRKAKALTVEGLVLAEFLAGNAAELYDLIKRFMSRFIDEYVKGFQS